MNIRTGGFLQSISIADPAEPQTSEEFEACRKCLDKRPKGRGRNLLMALLEGCEKGTLHAELPKSQRI